MQLSGIHHLTAVTANVRENFRFYTQVLGMRLVKRSVNQDDVSAYHLFYADAVGSPGTDMTFFDWAMPRETRGARSITRTALRVAGASSLDWWKEHLQQAGVSIGKVIERDGRLTLDFEDGEGQRLSLIDDGGSGDPSHPWDKSPVPIEHQVRGLGPITISVPALKPTEAVLTRALNMQQIRDYPDPDNAGRTVHVFSMGPGGASGELHLAVVPDLSVARLGAGGAHHVAFRTNDAQYEDWFERLGSLGIANSGEVDRYYFQSLYFREPGGILFEIATDGPGFSVDEDPATLGEQVALPPFLEARRQEIVTRLKPLD